ncbi:hypothetical protein [Calothrix sp. PCC 6303]|uniref:hypothetical protein n=1 Tax=Calothrix sp. PCC 6303 TaxID=1170562 RepID=UPI0002A050DE|nr:hypothetical protein [Calothrix sp. PCC 6303]AFZ03954.1 hypothetical protein Cal6303_5065 [Calothrix sp. PCC 6303]
MNTCPCCSHVLLRHVRGNETYWFCRNCWQEMPEMNVTRINLEAMTQHKNIARNNRKRPPSKVLSPI